MTPWPNEDAWWNDHHPDWSDLQVDLPEPADPPRLYGPDGDPLPVLVHRFGFQAAMEELT